MKETTSGPGSGRRSGILWVGIPAGPFLMGSAADEEMALEEEYPRHTVSLPAYLISRHPITNAQYRAFVESGGYDEPRYWTADGWAWRTGGEPDLTPIDVEDLRQQVAGWLAGRPTEKRIRPFWWDHPRWGLPKRPVVGVTWYEAAAYCRWIQEQVQMAGRKLHVWSKGVSETWSLQPGAFVIQLPSEAEWEKAARGTDGRRWPWGDEWVERQANTEEASIGETSAVGIFPGGASPYGAMDMAGDVWEWTRSRWGRTGLLRPDYGYPYNPTDGREESGDPDLRVVRGGSWNYSLRFARCAVRYRGVPGEFNHYLGFRVVVLLVPPSR